MDLCNINRKNYQFIYKFRQTSQTKTVIIELGEDKLMKEDLEKLELMIKNDSRYEDIIEQSMQMDKYIEKKIEGAL